MYLYDAAKISSQVEKMKAAFKGQKMRIKYAAKALTNISILKLMKSLGKLILKTFQ